MQLDLCMSKNIHKFHINYQPSLKLKRQLKGHIEVSKETKKYGLWFLSIISRLKLFTFNLINFFILEHFKANYKFTISLTLR
jgi:hypothetical protein